MDIGFIAAAGLILVLFVISPVDDMTMTLWTNTAHIVEQRWMVVSVNEIPQRGKKNVQRRSYAAMPVL